MTTTIAFNKSLRAVLRSRAAYELLPDGTWWAGGCWLLARALQRWLGRESELVGLFDSSGRLQHVACLYNAQFIDADGVIGSARRLISRFNARERAAVTVVGHVQATKAKRLLDVSHTNAQVRALARLLATIKVLAMTQTLKVDTVKLAAEIRRGSACDLCARHGVPGSCRRRGCGGRVQSRDWWDAVRWHWCETHKQHERSDVACAAAVRSDP